jgi:ABC-type spermidine/putrescine transport system permease subunit I
VTRPGGHGGHPVPRRPEPSPNLQFPLAAANAVVLLAVVLMIIVALTRMVDLRKEL